MRYLYYCNSAYQLVNVLNLNWHRKYGNFENINTYESDLIILNAFNGAREIVEILKNKNDFNNIYLIERFKNKGILHSISSFIDIVVPNRYITKSGIFENMKNRYDYLVVPKVSKITLSIWLLNKDAKIQFSIFALPLTTSSAKALQVGAPQEPQSVFGSISFNF